MIVDLEGDLPADLETDVAIIGAGAVGLLLAARLARKGLTVTVCESGGRSHEARSQKLNEAVVSGRPHLGVTEGRARLLGGTTTLWGGQLVAFRDVDFSMRPWLGIESWPIRRTELEPYYREVARTFGLAVEDDDDSSVWRGLKIEQPKIGDEFDVILTRWLKEPNLAQYFRGDIERLPNLKVVLHASAVGLVFGGSTVTVTGVELRSPSGKTATLKASRVIVACGTIEASRLMLAIAAKQPDVPWANNPWLGAGFQDHLDLKAAQVKVTDKKRFSDWFDNIYLGGFKYNPKIVLKPSVQAEEGLTNIASSFVFNSSLTEHISNIKIFLRALRNGSMPEGIGNLPGHLAAMAKVWWPLMMRYAKDHRMFNPADLGIQLNLHCEQLPMRESRITLAASGTDVNGMPLADLHWKIDGREVNAMAVFCERLDARFRALKVAELEMHPALAARDGSILEIARDTNHQCGGLRMAGDAANGVVDGRLKVHGTDNLFVAGAAVFPSSSFANPTFTAMALAMRLAKDIEEGPHANG